MAVNGFAVAGKEEAKETGKHPDEAEASSGLARERTGYLIRLLKSSASFV
jgi:hypothetical protein